jgi:hypothetical protein
MRILVFAAALVMCNVTATASDLIGIYALVDRVVLEPNDTAPDRIQIWGSFLLADGQPGEGFLAPECGYMYFTLPSTPAQQSRAKAEWNDLKKVAGSGQPVGFGSRWYSSVQLHPPHVRKPSADPRVQKRDRYPVSVGIVPVPRTDIIEQLHKCEVGLDES